MTISTENRIAGPFAGNGTTNTFPFTFKIFQAADLQVVLRPSFLGSEVVLIRGVDYTVSLNANQDANPGGDVVMFSAPAAGASLFITSQLPYLQPTELTNQGGFYPKVINGALDRLTILIQQVLAGLNRSLKVPLSDGNINTTIPSKELRKGRLLAFDETTGAPVVGPYIGGGVNGTVSVQRFTGDGVTVDFQLAQAPVLETSIQAFLAGAYQSNTGYDLTGANGDVLTFTSAPPNGAALEVVTFSVAPLGVTVDGQVLLSSGETLKDYDIPRALGKPTDTIINVPSQYPTINAAFASIANKRIPLGETCTIKVADGTYVLTAPLILNHPDGERLRVVGNETNEQLCKLTLAPAASPTFDMVVVSNGYTLGYLNGFDISIDIKATNYTGVLAVNGSKIYCGNKMRVNNFYYGIAARIGSTVYCDYAKVYNAGDVGIWAYVGSTISCNYAVSNGAIDVPNNLGFGIQAEFGSSIECTGASSSGCRIAGIASLSNSLVRAHGAVANSNLGSGFYASADGHIEHHNATANNNARYGEERALGGTIVGGSVTLSSNTLGSISGYAYFDNSGSLGARIAANGDLRIDVNGANNVYFNSSGGVQAQIAHTPSSNSWTQLRGSSGSQPGVEAAGNASNIDYNVRAKGSGRVFLASQRPNFVTINGATSGGTPSVVPEGSDTNCDLLLTGKGSGSVRLGKHFAGAPTPNGYIEFKLEDGATVRIAAERL